MAAMKRFFLGALLLVVVVGVLYAPTASFGFLHLDDHDYTFRCPFVFEGLSWANVKAAFMNVRHAGVWMPLTYISYMADISFFGAAPGPHHLVNVALHMANTVLLLVLAWRLTRGRNIGWLLPAVAFWALHPQRVEAVAWIASRKELLWAGFALLGLLCWESAGRAAGGAIWRYAAAYTCCALACMSKPTAMCFPLLALGVDLASRRCIGSCDGNEAPHVDRPTGATHMNKPMEKPLIELMRELRSRIRPYLPLVLMALATGSLALYSQTHPEGHEVRALFSASLPWRLLNAAAATGLSIFQMIVPIGIHLDYRAVPGQFPLHGTLGLATLGVALAGGAWLVRARPRRDAALPNILWFFAALLPTLGIFGSFGEHARADRFLYVPMMAVALAAAGMAAREGAREQRSQDVQEKPTGTGRRLTAGRLAWRIGAGVYLAAMAVAAWPVIDSYRSDKTAFMRTLAFDPGNGRALAHVGQAECAQRDGIDRGIEHLRQSQAIRPRDNTAAQLAYALAMRGHSGDFNEIRRLCGKFACNHQLDTKGQALEALGMTAMRQRRWNEAIGCLYDSIRAPQRFYSNEDAMLKLAACLCNAGRQDEAMRWLEQLTRSKRMDIRGKAIQSLETLKRNPRAVLFLD